MPADHSREQHQAHVVRRGSGVPVIAVQGNGLDRRLVLSLDPTLEASGGFERFYLDLAGFGETSALSGVAGLPELANWLVAQVSELVSDRPFAVLANSLGGLLARHLRTAFPYQVIGLALLPRGRRSGAFPPVPQS